MPACSRHASAPVFRSIAVALAVFIVVSAALCSPAVADSWMSPYTRRFKSANGKFMATAVPGERRKGPLRPQLTVRAADAPDNAPALWAAELSNKAAPIDVLVTDDGRHVITFDNWYGVGYGDDVVAFYSGGRQLAKYSLEQILSEREIGRASCRERVSDTV